MWKKYSYFVLLTYLLVGFWLWPQVGVIALVCMVAPIVLAFKYGRKWCGSYCPRGSLWDNVFAKINDNKKFRIGPRINISEYLWLDLFSQCFFIKCILQAVLWIRLGWCFCK